MEVQLFIRVRGRVLGPYDHEKLQSLARRGQFSRLHEVSSDGASWVRASTYPELFTALAAATAETANPPSPAIDPGHRDPKPATSLQVVPPSAAPAGTLWYYSNSGTQQGPVELSYLEMLISGGRLSETDLVWNEGMTEWTAAGWVPALARHFSSPPSGKSGGRQSRSGEQLPAALCRAATASRGWVLFITITLFVYAALMALVGVLSLALEINLDRTQAVASGLFSLIQAAMATVGALLLLKYSSRLGQLASARSTAVLEASLDAIKAFWIYVSILMIVFIAFMVVVMVILLAASSRLPA
ncbi:MAG: DUF4339 domain-containing protein [Pirellulales bacterium]